MNSKIPFNKAKLTGREFDNIKEAINQGHLSGNGKFSKKCHEFFEKRYGFRKCLLTTSCTDALEMAALLLNISPGDEIILPSYTFVSSANPFIMRGAKLVFCDSRKDRPGLDEEQVEPLITENTKAIVIVHYAGMSCDMKILKAISRKYDVPIIEDAAQAIESFFIEDGKSEPLGGIGDIATFSFHETKNITSGEGGLLVINNEKYTDRSEIIWEKGTNRAAFFRGEVDKYGWVDIGSSFLPSEIIAAFLYAQLLELESIQESRIKLWESYYQNLDDFTNKLNITLPVVPDFATINGHLFYILCESLKHRDELTEKLKQENIFAVFHYQSLHKSKFYRSFHDGRDLPNADRFSNTLLRLPLHLHLGEREITRICEILTF